MAPHCPDVFLPQLFDLTSFAPQLETLEIISPFWRNTELEENLERLDQGIQSHTSLQCIVLVALAYGYVEGFEDRMKKCMPLCAEKGMMKFDRKPE